MIKLSDIIKSGGGNEKINRFINRYVLSKKEKKYIINEIKTKGSSSGGSSKYAPRYFSIDWDKCSDSWKYILSSYDQINGVSYYDTIGFSATVKSSVSGDCIISVGWHSPIENIIAFSYMPVNMPNYIQEECGVEYQMPFNFNDLIEFINRLINEMLNLGIEPILMEGITEITEEEFYKMD